MIEYREKQKKNIVVLSVAIVLMIIANLLRPILDAFGITTSKADDFMNGVLFRFSNRIIGVAILKIIESIRILKSDKFFKKYMLIIQMNAIKKFLSVKVVILQLS